MLNVNSTSSTSSLQQVQERQQTLLERLASGRQVNSAADGAAAQQIIDRLTSEVEGNRQAISNAYDGISLAQVAEGGFDSIGEDVNRIRELTVQAGNGILSAGDREAIQSEISQLQDNISQTIEQTNFAGRPLLGEDGGIDFQVGSGPGQTTEIETRDAASGLSNLLSIDVTAPGGVDAALEAADEAVEFVGESQAQLGATQSGLERTASRLAQADISASAARSRIQDTDFAQATSESAAANVLGQANIAVQAQANQQQGQVLALLGA